jgi:phosphate transport system substrate-binding protein
VPVGGGSGSSGIVRLAMYTTPLVLAVLTAVIYFGGGADSSARGQTGSVQVAGSETMRPVVAACAEDFMVRNPQADIIVKGGGSGDGIAALLHGLVDIGMASRDLSDRERDYAVARGIELSQQGLALDGITIIVNRTNTFAGLSVDQLRDIFAGKIRTWRELEGADTEIAVFARAPGSGTASLFADRVLGEGTYAESAQRLPTNEAIVAAVGARPEAIGYTSLGALKGASERVKVVALRPNPDSEPVAPTQDSILARTYPLTRTLWLTTAGKPSGTALAFVEFCSSTSGQALLQRAGYVAIPR